MNNGLPPLPPRHCNEVHHIASFRGLFSCSQHVATEESGEGRGGEWRGEEGRGEEGRGGEGEGTGNSTYTFEAQLSVLCSQAPVQVGVTDAAVLTLSLVLRPQEWLV